MGREVIVVGYDGSPDADLALGWAAESARTGPTGRHRIQVVVVGTDLDPIGPVLGQVQATSDRHVDEWRRRALEQLAELQVHDGDVEVRRGSTVPELLQASEQATMLVVGSRGHGLLAGSLTGSVSQHLARHATCPVVVVRPKRAAHARRITVGVDGSAESSRAVRFACERAATTGEQVVAVHGYHAYASNRTGFEVPLPATVLRRMQATERFLAEALAGVATDFPEVEVVPQAIPVPAARLLVDCSSAASLVVVGSRGRDAFAGLLLGSVSAHLLRHAECPVAVVR